MPYRRLPNTDAARKTALSRALELGKKMRPDILAFFQSILAEINAFLPVFEQAMLMQKEAITRQNENSGEYKESYKRAKLYISHFIQVFNFAILRGELKSDQRLYFGMKKNDTCVPELSSEQELIYWAEKLIKGENERIIKRETAIQNPSIAVLKVYYDEFNEQYSFQKMLRSITAIANDKVSALRPKADLLILNLWNEIEAYYKGQIPEKLREQASYYGVKYVYRPHERNQTLIGQMAG